MKYKVLVKRDQGRGRQMGFPTANFDLDEEIEEGIYIGLVGNAPSLSASPTSPPKGENNLKATMPALVFIGANVTFGESTKHGEVYILDFSGDLYDQEIEVEVLKKIRENQKFGSQAELVEQMKKDEAIAREFFKGYNISN